MNVCCVLLLTAAAMLAVTDAGTILSKRSDCSEGYRKLGERKGIPHTMCNSKYDKNAQLLKESGVSEEDKAVIVAEHNRLRADPGKGMVPSNSEQMYWDENLAIVVKRMVESCLYPDLGGSHDKLRDVPGYGFTCGQNLAYGYGDWKEAIGGWYSEVKEFNYGSGEGFILHYTQMEQHQIARVGCAFAVCGDKKVYGCNYAGWQYTEDVKRPFKEGRACGDCPKTCNSATKLCDCKGKMCYNGGTLDPNTCTCKCPDLFTGETCDAIDCSTAKDGFICSQYGKDSCVTFSNFPTECPVMCGTCDLQKPPSFNPDDTAAPNPSKPNKPDTTSSPKEATTSSPKEATTKRTNKGATEAPPTSCTGDDCQDKNKNCPNWAAAGYCVSAESVQQGCKKSCKENANYQSSGCSDKYVDCKVWKEMKYNLCEVQSEEMAQHCKKTCTAC